MKKLKCPKCGATSGDDWSQCQDFLPCPMPGGPKLIGVDEGTPGGDYTAKVYGRKNPDGSVTIDDIEIIKPK